MRRLALLASLLGVTSCDRIVDDGGGIALDDAAPVFFTEFCTRQTDCCSPFEIPAMGECQTNVRTQIERMTEIAEDEELTYDPTCWLAEVEHLRDRDCGSEPIDDGCTPPCRPWYGHQEVGDYCSTYDFALSNCGPGLVCAPSVCPASDCPLVCHDPCARAELGEPCLDVPCEVGLVCDVVGDACVRAPEIGERCLPGSVCGEGAMCDPDTNACVPAVADAPGDAPGAPGAPCNAYWQCESASCPAGYCADGLPGEGEECTGRCSSELVCDATTGRCGAAGPAVCTDDPL